MISLNPAKHIMKTQEAPYFKNSNYTAKMAIDSSTSIWNKEARPLSPLEFKSKFINIPGLKNISERRKLRQNEEKRLESGLNFATGAWNHKFLSRGLDSKDQAFYSEKEILRPTEELRRSYQGQEPTDLGLSYKKRTESSSDQASAKTQALELGLISLKSRLEGQTPFCINTHRVPCQPALNKSSFRYQQTENLPKIDSSHTLKPKSQMNLVKEFDNRLKKMKQELEGMKKRI